MSQESMGRVTKALSELVVIVLGILLALWADASWASRQAAAEERAYLEALQGDFVQLRGDAADRLATYSEWLRAMDQLLSPSVRDSEPDSINQWLADGLFQINEFEPPLPTLDDLVTTGKLSVLTSAGLRAQLAILIRTLEELSEVEAELSGVQFDLIDPFLVRNGDIGRLGRARGIPEAVPKARWDHNALLDADEFINLVNLKVLTVTFLRDQLSAVAASGEGILVTIEEALGP